MKKKLQGIVHPVYGIPFPPTLKCPACGQQVEHDNGKLRYHDHPKPCRQVCHGSLRQVENVAAILTPEEIHALRIGLVDGIERLGYRLDVAGALDSHEELRQQLENTKLELECVSNVNQRVGELVGCELISSRPLVCYVQDLIDERDKLRVQCDTAPIEQEVYATRHYNSPVVIPHPDKKRPPFIIQGQHLAGYQQVKVENDRLWACKDPPYPHERQTFHDITDKCEPR
jgi:hypothetical protein